jgi:hypothetical protein
VSCPSETLDCGEDFVNSDEETSECLPYPDWLTPVFILFLFSFKIMYSLESYSKKIIEFSGLSYLIKFQCVISLLLIGIIYLCYVLPFATFLS